MEIKPIARFRSPFPTKFGIPRQAGLASGLRGRIVFEPEFRSAEAVRGLEGFDYLWLIWEFSEAQVDEKVFKATVRPPRLGDNERVGVFASRSPFRPNRLGLSSVRILSIDLEAKGADGKPSGPVIEVSGADLMDGTPIYDIKPYLSYVDSHPEARGGFTDDHEWQRLQVAISDEYAAWFDAADLQVLKQVLSLDPRPHYHHDDAREYGMPFKGCDIRFKVSEGVLYVTSIER